MSQQLRVSISAIEFVREAWAREEADDERVTMLRALIRDEVVLDPVELVRSGAERYLAADGIHRITAYDAEGHAEIDAIVIEPQLGESAIDCAFRRGLETAATAPAPLRPVERTRAVRLLLERHPAMPDQQIAALCGVSRQTVWRYRSGRCNATVDEQLQRISGSRVPRLPTADDLARDFVSRLVKLDAGRGILDRINPHRMGRHLGSALKETFGDAALDRASRFEAWLHAAVIELGKVAT
jgi:hypothetical protein